MIVLNFAHPLTPDQIAAIEAAAGEPVTAVHDLPSQVDVQQPLEPQIAALLDGLDILPAEWQTHRWLVNLPSLNFSAAVLIAILHGRLGYFPACLRLRPADSPIRQFEFAEILDLSAIRDRARLHRA